ncbi:MAG: ACT domain-containing protein, partial [Spirochaetota bacterium]
LLDLVNQSNIGPVQMSVGVDSVSIVASRDRLERSRKHLKEQIKKILSPDRLEISDDLAVVAVVGEGITSNPTAASRVFSVMEEQGIPVKYSVFSPDLSITLGVERKRYTDAIQALYRCFAE